MSDHEFEKQVQQKMGELKFRPSDAVWAGVEKNIRRDKRRRRALIWLPLLFLLLATGGYVVFSGKQDGTKTAINNDHASTSKEHSDATAQHLDNNHADNNNSSVHKGVTGNKTTTLAEQPIGEEKVHNRPSRQHDAKSTLPITEHVNKNTKLKPTADKYRRAGNKESIAKTDEPETTPAQTKAEPDKVSDNTKVTDNTDVVVAEPAKDSAKQEVVAVQPQKAKEEMVLISEPVHNSTAKIQPEKTSKWQWGITGGIGISNMAEGGILNILNKTKVEDLAYASVPAPSLQYNLAINPPQTRRQSPIDAGPAFSVGAFVKTAVSKKLSVSAGLQYNYFGLNTMVGDLVKSSRAINVSFDTRIVSQYYGGNNMHDYLNQYHFIVLPVELQWQINKSQKTPISLEGGIAISQLLYTNALHYDGSGGIYYKDNSLFNKTQLDLLMGFNVGLLQRSKHPLSIGPDLHYSMTRLVKKDVSNGQYLWSAGISAKMLLKK